MASISVYRQFLAALAREDAVRDALRSIEQLAEYCGGRTPTILLREKGIDLFSVVSTDLPLPEAFWAKRFPQLTEQIHRRRQR
jgi:hypothetical protein